MDKLPKVNNYMKNLGKSIKYVAINEIRETLPIVFETKETNEEALSSIRASFRNKNKLKTISTIAKDSEFYKTGNDIYKNLKSSIKTGNFYSQKRQDKADNEFMKSFMGEDFNFDDDFKDEEGFDESEDSLNENADSLNELSNDLNSGFEASATAISNTTIESARYVGETVKASAAMAYAQNSEQTFLMRTGFKSLDDGLKKLVHFNSDILQKHIQNSTTFFDNTSKLLAEQNAMMKEMLEMQRNVYKANQAAENNNNSAFNKFGNIVSSGGAVNLSEYFKNIKSNFSEWSEPIMMMLNMLKANPLEAVLQGGLSLIGSDSMKKAGANLNKTLSGAFGKYLSFLEKQAKKNGGIWETINDIFGVRNARKTDIDTSKYQKGPMQFNGVANKAITEVIPGYLARIESALTGGDERYFNFNNGRWTNTTKIRKKYNKELNDTDNGLGDLIGEIKGALNKVNYNNYNNTKINSKDKEEIFNKIMQTIVDKNGDIDDSFIVRRRDKTGHDTIDHEAFYNAFGYNAETLTDSQKAMLNVMATVLANTNSSTRASLNNTVRRAKSHPSEYKQSIEDDPYNINRILVNGQLSGSRFVKDAVAFGEGSIEKPDRYRPSEALLQSRQNNNNSNNNQYKKIKYKKNKKGKKNRRKNQQVVNNNNRNNESIGAVKNAPVDYAKNVFYKTASVEDFIALFDHSDEPILRAFIGYINGLGSITKLNESQKAVSEFISLTKSLDTADFIYECKEYADYISCKQEESGVKTSTQFNKLPRVVKNFYYYIFSLCSKETVNTSEALGKYTTDINTETREFEYDNYEGSGLFDKLDKAKGLNKIGVLASYTKKLTSMPFDILGSVIAKTDKIIYDMFFGNEQITDTNTGKKVTGFFQLMTSKIGKAVEDLYGEIKERIWGKDQWKTYKDTVYNRVLDLVNLGKGMLGFDSTGVNIKGSVGKLSKEEKDKLVEGKVDEKSGLNKATEENANTKKEDKDKETAKNNNGFYTPSGKSNLAGSVQNSNIALDTTLKTGTIGELSNGIDAAAGSNGNSYTSLFEPTKGAVNTPGKKRIKKWQSIYGAAYGLGMVPKTDIYTLHKGEAVIPAYMNPSYNGTDIDPKKHAKDEAAVAKKYGLNIKGYAEGTAKEEESKEVKKDKETMVGWLKRTYPAALGEGTVGAILGTIVAGPFGLIGGATLGAANYILKNSTAANKFLFGDEEKRSLFSRTKSGLSKILPKSITNFFKEQDRKVRDIGKMSVAGGALGLIGGALGGPFGLMGGLMLGAATGVLKNYDSAQKLMFGNHDVKGKLDKALNHKYLKSIGLGALAGGLVLGGPLGLLGGALLGVAGKYASESDKFKDFMFGKKNKKGNRNYKNGYLGMIGEKILAPLGTLKDDIVKYMDKNVFQPISRAFTPLTRITQLGMRKLFRGLQKGFDVIVNPSLKLRWYKNLPIIMRGPAGRYIGHGLAGAAGGFMYGGPLGALIGGVLGGASAFKVKDKTIASWLGKGIATIGTVPGKALDFVTRKLDKKLIAKGNMDSISMSAKDRVDFMEKHGYQYAKEEYKQNDITLRDSSTSQLQAMKDTIEIIKLSKEKSNRNKSKIEGKIRDVVKSIPNLDLSGMQKVLKIIRKAIKSEDNRAIPEAIDKISDYLRLRGLSDDQIESYIRPLRIGMSGLSANKAVNNAMDQDIANRSEYLKKNFNFNVVDGDIDKALEQVDSELQSRDKKGDTIEKESLDKGDAAIVESTNKVNNSIRLSNIYLAAITDYMRDGKVSEKTERKLKKFTAVDNGNIVAKTDSKDSIEESAYQFSQKTGTMIKMVKTSDGGYKPDTTDKDTKEAIEKADAERDAIMSLGQYAKSKLKGTKKSLKNRLSKFANSAIFGGFKDIFKSIFGTPLGIVGDILGMIPGANLLKGKLTRFAGNKLGGWADKLANKAQKLKGTGKFLGKVGGKLLGAGSFLLKNVADAASAAADAEESTPEFETELEAFNYMARKISGVEAAVVAMDQFTNNQMPDFLKAPGSIHTTIDPKTGKPVKAKTGKGFLGGWLSSAWHGATSAASSVWNGVKAVASKPMAAVGSVIGWVQNGLKKVFNFAAKFLPSNIGNKISSFGSAILKKVSNPKVAVKVAEKASSKGIQLGLGPIGWAFLAGNIAVSFYQGYNNAETIWKGGSANTSSDEDLSMGDKAICGVCSVVANELLMGIMTPSEVLGIAKSIFGKIKGVTDTIKEKASSIMSTISQYKDKLLNTGKEMWNKVKTSFGSFWNNIKDSVGNAIQTIKDTFEKFKKIGYDTLVEILKSPIEWIKKKASSLFGFGGDDKKTSTPATNKTYTSPKPTAAAIPADTSKVDPNVDPDHGIGTGLPSTAINYGKPDLNVDPDNGIGTGENGTNTKKTWREKYDGIYVRGKKVATGGPLSGNSLLRYRLASIGGGDMTPAAIWDTLTTKYHYSNQAAAAIMGSMQQESSFDPNASQNGGGIEASIAQGEGKNGFGLCQWTGSRTQALVNFCSSNNLDPTTAEGQIAFMNYEMGQRGSNAAFNSAGSVDDALKVMQQYEGYGEVGNRDNYARQIFQNQGRGITTSGSASGGSGSKSSGDNSIFGRIDKLFDKAFAPFTSIFGNLFGDSSDSNSNSSGSGGAGSAATDMSGTIDSGSTADKLLANLKSEAGGDAVVSAPYGEANHQGHTHGGIDIAAPEGTPIKSPIAGTVIDNRYGGGYGNYVQIKDKNNMDHLFPHMVSPSPLEEGTEVSVGDTVGYIGSTGNSTGPHIHYEIDDDAVNRGAEVSKPHINPGKYMGGPLSGDSTLKFRKKVNDLANAGNRAAIKALKKGYGTDNVGVGGPLPGDNLVNNNIAVKDYSDQLNQIISLLSIIAGAVQSQASTPVVAANVPTSMNDTMSTTTPNTSLLNIVKSMMNIASH